MLTAWNSTLVRALDAAGFDGNALAVAAGLPVDALADPDRRIPLATSTKLWRAAIAATGDPAFGIEVSRFVRPAAFHALGHAFLASPSLSAGLERAARYCRATADIAVATTEIAAGPSGEEFRFQLRWRAGSERPAFEAVDAAVASIVRTARYLLDRRVAPTHLRLERPAPADRTRFDHFFACPITFEAEFVELAFDLAVAERPIPGGNVAIAGMCDRVVADYLAALQPATFADQVKRVVSDLLPGGEPSMRAVARPLRTSSRTLQRELHREGVTFRELVAQVRRDLAIGYLRDGHRSVTEVAYLLGFSETAAFTHAFKRWTGTPPSQFV